MDNEKSAEHGPPIAGIRSPSTEDTLNTGAITNDDMTSTTGKVNHEANPVGDLEEGERVQQINALVGDPNLVDWDGPTDPDNPMNWTVCWKWYITMMLSLLTFCITFSSSIFSQATGVTASVFGVAIEVTTLGTSLVVLGFALGPLLWGPLSEVYGRLPPLYIGFAISAIFQIPVAVSENVHTVLICRFFIGMFGSSPLAIVGGTSADLWDPVYRAIAVATIAASTFLGPIVGPIVGGLLVQSHLGWRWTAWITLFIDAFLGIICLFTIPETYAPVILQRRAARLRWETRNWALHSLLDEHPLRARDVVTKYLTRPIRMLILEPILLLFTIYLSIVYGIFYIFFFAYPISFQEVRGWKDAGMAAIPFLGLMVGILLGCALIVYLTKTRFARKFKETGRVVPEERLPAMIFGAILLPVGLFWFSWTSSPNISWVLQTMAGIPIGLGTMLIFLQGFNYIVDVYLPYVSSALAANILVRSATGAAFPLFATDMFHMLGVQWAGSLLGFLTVAMIPVPVLFYIYGLRIRAKSRFSK